MSDCGLCGSRVASTRRTMRRVPPVTALHCEANEVCLEVPEAQLYMKAAVRRKNADKSTSLLVSGNTHQT